MKKTIILLFIAIFFYGCSTSSDSNGNDNTTVVPLAPTNLTGQVISSTQINLSWIDNSTNETGFKIERKTIAGTYVIVGNTTADINTYSDTNITPNTTYTYRVYSYNTIGNSITYSNEISLPITSVTDIDGHIYQLITICNKTWTKSNLNVSRYRNGDIIPEVPNLSNWKNLTTGAWCYYANNSSNGVTYGKLYNWHAINDPRGLAPQDYHIPSVTEWNDLINCLGGMNVAGGKMKATGTTLWQNPNGSATNESGFTGLPGGSVDPFLNNGSFTGIGLFGFWWSSTLNSNILEASYFSLNASDGTVNSGQENRKYGFAVRCVKD
jgi:uncharacterized protein (TIGR02145 family)